MKQRKQYQKKTKHTIEEKNPSMQVDDWDLLPNDHEE